MLSLFSFPPVYLKYIEVHEFFSEYSFGHVEFHEEISYKGYFSDVSVIGVLSAT